MREMTKCMVDAGIHRIQTLLAKGDCKTSTNRNFSVVKQGIWYVRIVTVYMTRTSYVEGSMHAQNSRDLAVHGEAHTLQWPSMNLNYPQL